MSALPLASPAGLNLRRVTRTYHLRSAVGGGRLATAAVTPGGVQLTAGSLTVGRRTVRHPRFDRNTISWSQSDHDGIFSGVLHFRPDGLAFTGRTFNGTQETTLVGVVPPTVFKTQVAETETPPTAQDPGGWEQGVELTLGYTVDDQSQFPVQVIKLADQDATSFTALSVDPANENLVVTVVFEQSIASLGAQTVSPNWPATARIEIGWDGATFTGTLCRYDSATGEPSADKHAWDGASPDSAGATAGGNGNGHGALAVAQAAADDQPAMTIEDLVTQSPIGADKIANDMIVQNLQWAIPDDWRDNFFGVAKPTLSADRIALIDKSLDFYQKQFGPAYVGWSVNDITGPGAPSHPLSSDDKSTLQYYLHDGLGQSKDYNLQSQGIALDAFIEACPRLALYIADTKSNWAQQVYDCITATKFFTNTVLHVIADGTLEVPNRYSMLLNALDSSGALAAKYYKAIMTRSLAHISDQVDLSSEDSVKAWLPDVLEAFLKTFLTAPSNSSAARLELQAQAQALQDLIDKLGGFQVVANALTDIVVGAKGNGLLGKASSAAEEFARRFPTSAKFANGILVCCWAGGLTCSIISACDWSNLNTKQRVGLVTGLVEQFGTLVEAVPDVLDKAAWVGARAMRIFEDVYGYFSTANSLADLDALADAVDNNWIYKAISTLTGMFDAAKGIVTDGTLLARFFKIAPLIMKWLGVVVAGVFAALSVWQLVDDFTTGAPTLQKSFDFVIAATSFVVLACAIVEIFVDLVVIPVLGAIAAIIGAIFAIVEAFLPKPKTPTPVDTFVDNVLRPFVATLPKPPASWAPPAAPAPAPEPVLA
jgi:hypothetical protein